MASVKFRWNVSGSYMQVLPRFVSCAADGKSDEREFLREYFSGPAEMYDAIFLKGYQWPFAAGHVPGSSMIDIYVNREIVERGTFRELMELNGSFARVYNVQQAQHADAISYKVPVTSGGDING
jgi:hypothetical protein